MRTPRPLLLAAALSAACGGQMGAGSQYPGDPLFQYSGRVEGTAPLPPIEVGFVWQRQPPPSMDDMALATAFPVWEADETTRWVAFLYLHPPAEAYTTLQNGEVLFARGNAISIPEGWDRDVNLLPGASDAYGADVSHWVLYFPYPVPAGSLTAWWLGGEALPAGFHLVGVTPRPCPEGDVLASCITELRGRGVPTDEAAQGFCEAPYALAPVRWAEESTITLGVSGFATRTCP